MGDLKLAVQDALCVTLIMIKPGRPKKGDKTTQLLSNTKDKYLLRSNNDKSD